MKCEQIAELLPDYLQGNLRPEQSKSVEEHIAQCAECRDDVAIWQKLSLLPAEEPSPAGRQRFDAMLQAYKSAREENVTRLSVGEKLASFWEAFRWLRTPAGAVAWSLLLLLAGGYIGAHMKTTDSRPDDVAAMRSELANMRQLVALSMLQQESASGRLEGVTWTRREEHLDPQVVSALLHTLRYDPNVDVRLAALDALSRHSTQPQVRNSVVDALQAQQSPLVQVAVIDQLVQWRDRQAAPRLEQLQRDPKLNPAVRQRAEWAISQLN